MKNEFLNVVLVMLTPSSAREKVCDREEKVC
jgi:hypothetical protein